ncbi:hypothetical protein GEMRC1_008795 [Eukaryota sp. GEM-RC1]
MTLSPYDLLLNSCCDSIDNDIDDALNCIEKLCQEPQLHAAAKKYALFLHADCLREIWVGEEHLPDTVETTEFVDSIIEEAPLPKPKWCTEDQFQSLYNLCSACEFTSTLNSGHLDLDTVLKIHSLIGKDLIQGAGTIRTIDVMPFQSANMYLTHHEVPKRLSQLLQWVIMRMKSISDDVSSAVRVTTVFFAHFLQIHPFVDGNGRTAQLLVTVLMGKLVPTPFSVVSPKLHPKLVNELEHSQMFNRFSGLASIIVSSILTYCSNLKWIDGY